MHGTVQHSSQSHSPVSCISTYEWASSLPRRSHGMITCLQDQMETGSVRNDKLKTTEEEPSTSELAGALAMLGLEHAHVIHEADPDTKVASLAEA